ncbi:MAG: RibD family protein [Cyanobacteriota bacterium]
MNRPRLRLVLAVSLDGRLAPAEGGPAQLGGEGDRRVLETALSQADAVLVGAETVRIHGTSCLIHQPDLLQARLSRGQPPQPLVVVWSRSGRFPPHLPFFQQPFERWLLLPSSPPPPPAVPNFDRVLAFADWPTTLDRFATLGIGHLVVLGGARLAAALVAARALDEVQLTLCPRLLGGSHGWLPADGPGDPATPWTLRVTEVLPGGELLLLYERGELA